MISYAQNFEDVMLERLFNDQNNGLYVDVGAWDPHLYSVTKHFYLKGWRGVNVEPNVSRIRRFELDRPKDLNLNVAIANKNDNISFWTCQEDDALSTTAESTADELRRNGFSFSETKISARRLDEIFHEYNLTAVDFMKVDVEGAEAEVIRTAAFELYRPRVLIIEAIKPTLRPDWSEPASVGTWDSWESYVLNRGYVFAHFDGLNRFYIRKEDQSLADRLCLPPGVYDNIENLVSGTSAEAVSNKRSGASEAAEALKAERAALKAELAAFKASTFWRMTAPLRYAVNLVR